MGLVIKMIYEELVEYTNTSMAKSQLTVSKLGLEEMKKRFNKKESDGGYSEYWKTSSLESVNTNRKLKVKSHSIVDGERVIIWEKA